MTIAHGLNRGLDLEPGKVPNGTVELEFLSAVPSELNGLGSPPGVETPGYSHLSLRDKRNWSRFHKL